MMQDMLSLRESQTARRRHRDHQAPRPAACAHRSAVRRRLAQRPRRRGRRSARSSSRRARRARHGDHGCRHPALSSVRRRGGGGEGVRALRPAVGADRRRPRQVDRPRHRGRGDGLHPHLVGQRGAGARGTCARPRTCSRPCGTRRATAGRGWRSTSRRRSSRRASSAPSKSTIQQLVALAALMPIVASIGGNTGNQTVALVVRGLALDQITGVERLASPAQGAHRQPPQRAAVGHASSACFAGVVYGSGVAGVGHGRAPSCST